MRRGVFQRGPAELSCKDLNKMLPIILTEMSVYEREGTKRTVSTTQRVFEGYTNLRRPFAKAYQARNGRFSSPGGDR